MSTYAEYEELLEKAKVEPNFFVSAPYFAAAGWWVLPVGQTRSVRGDVGTLMLPPVDRLGLVPGRPVYGFPGYRGDSSPGQPWDEQFIYDPAAVASLEGHRRQVFRKNVRRFVRENPKVEYRPPDDWAEVCRVAAEWFEEGSKIYDLDVVFVYLQTPAYDRARILSVGGQPVGANIWDENWRYINYRYAFHDRKIPRASEYLRWAFYNEIAKTDGKLVNDGGPLGSPSLRQFKLKLGPERIVPVRTWAEKGGG